MLHSNFVSFFELTLLRLFQHNGLKLDKDLNFSGLVQYMGVCRMARRSPRKFDSFSFFFEISQKLRKKVHGLIWQLQKMAMNLMN